MKRMLALLLVVMMLGTLLVACNKKETGNSNDDLEELIEVSEFVDGDDTYLYDVNEVGKYEIIGFTSRNSAPHEIKIPDEIKGIEVTNIAAEAFKASNSISSVVMQNNMEQIGEYAFFGCLYLTQITLPDTLTTIGKGAFEECTALETVKLSKHVTTVDAFAFRNCTALKTLELNDELATIGASAFWGCKALGEVAIPASVKTVGDSAFYKCAALAKVTVAADAKLGVYVLNECAETLKVIVDLPADSAWVVYLTAQSIAMEKPAPAPAT